MKLLCLISGGIDSPVAAYLMLEKEHDVNDKEVMEEVQKGRRQIYKKLEEMDNYYKVFKKIEESPESYLDLNSALELVKVMGFPSLFALISAILSFYFA